MYRSRRQLLTHSPIFTKNTLFDPDGEPLIAAGRPIHGPTLFTIYTHQQDTNENNLVYKYLFQMNEINEFYVAC